jgi:hypothetical protein
VLEVLAQLVLTQATVLAAQTLYLTLQRLMVAHDQQRLAHQMHRQVVLEAVVLVRLAMEQVETAHPAIKEIVAA